MNIMKNPAGESGLEVTADGEVVKDWLLDLDDHLGYFGGEVRKIVDLDYRPDLAGLQIDYVAVLVEQTRRLRHRRGVRGGGAMITAVIVVLCVAVWGAAVLADWFSAGGGGL